MKYQARRLLFSVSLTLGLLHGVETRLAFGQGATGNQSGSAQSTQAGQQNSAQPHRNVSVRRLPANILQDQKPIFSFPRELAKGKHWLPTIGVLGVTASLVASDPYTAPTFRTTNSFNTFNHAFSSVNTGAFIAAVPAA